MSTGKAPYQGPPADAMPVKGTVIATQPAETILEGTVVATTAWPVQLCCFDNCNCCADLPLCCYAFYCAPCLWAEAAEYLQVNTLRSATDAEACAPSCCCTTRRCATNYWALVGYSCATSLTQQLCQVMGCQPVGQFINLTPLLTMRSRQQLERQGLEVECGHAYCADYWCFPCSAYQQAVYVKHVLKQDFTCCTYQGCCKESCCPCVGQRLAPGEMSLRLGATPAHYAAVTTAQSGFV